MTESRALEALARTLEALAEEQTRIGAAYDEILSQGAPPAIADEEWSPEPERERVRRRPSGRRKPERDVVAEGIALLRQRGYARKVHGGAYGNAGEPDVDAVVNGRACKFEAKASGNKPTAVQIGAMKRWAKAGALVGWFRGNQHLEELLLHLDDVNFVPDLTQPGCTCPLHPVREA